jgi:thioredoxin-related protein
MKKIVLILALITSLFAEGYKDFAKEMGYETNYKAALERAKKENKKLMVLMVTNYCPWCTKFEKKTLSDKAVDIVVKSKYVPLIINKEEKNFPKYLETPIVPALFFVKPTEEKAFYENVGFANKIDFLNLLEQLE